MKKFQLAPITNIGLINIILDKALSLGYLVTSRQHFTNPKEWISNNPNVGQYIQFGSSYISNDNYYVTRDDELHPDYEIISLEKFFKLTPEDCQDNTYVSLDTFYDAIITRKSVFIPCSVHINKDHAIKLAKKILEVMK